MSYAELIQRLEKFDFIEVDLIEQHNLQAAMRGLPLNIVATLIKNYVPPQAQMEWCLRLQITK